MGGNKRYPRDPAPDLKRRHCWVLRNRYRNGTWPGLIIQWDKMINDEWRAFVAYCPNPSRPDESVMEWMPRAWLRPVDTEMPGQGDYIRAGSGPARL